MYNKVDTQDLSQGPAQPHGLSAGTTLHTRHSNIEPESVPPEARVAHLAFSLTIRGG